MDSSFRAQPCFFGYRSVPCGCLRRDPVDWNSLSLSSPPHPIHHWKTLKFTKKLLRARINASMSEPFLLLWISFLSLLFSHSLSPSEILYWCRNLGDTMAFHLNRALLLAALLLKIWYSVWKGLEAQGPTLGSDSCVCLHCSDLSLELCMVRHGRADEDYM